MKSFFNSEKSSLLFIFAFFDGLGVASGAIFGFFFPKLVSDIFGANFGTNDLIWFQFGLLPGGGPRQPQPRCPAAGAGGGLRRAGTDRLQPRRQVDRRAVEPAQAGPSG